MFKQLFCTHDWVKETETTLCRADDFSGSAMIPYAFFNKKYIVIFKCTKCGKLKKFVEVLRG